MTPLQARQKLRSLLYRARLAKELPEIEAELAAFLQAEGPQIIDGYRLDVQDGRLIWEQLPDRQGTQLSLFEEVDS